ncbi:UNVERIFIED_CONTAM: hypothetical protein Slati_1932800 [Sesamum latifolium]|uniref:Uncharacterized protein n=1 Tax=Sesamum latifolium TaxID=2727402 RepID=A0AAW2X456_9LAMI
MRDGIEDMSTDTNSDDSSSVKEYDHKSSTSSNDIGEEVVHSRHVRAQIIRERVSNIHDGRLRGTRREQWGEDHDRGKMDSFDFLVLFLIALALVWCVPMFFGGV